MRLCHRHSPVLEHAHHSTDSLALIGSQAHPQPQVCLLAPYSCLFGKVHVSSMLWHVLFCVSLLCFACF